MVLSPAGVAAETMVAASTKRIAKVLISESLVVYCEFSRGPNECRLRVGLLTLKMRG